jgi:hypothetical protein
MSEQEKPKPKAKFERNVKSCTIEIIGKRYARNPESYKPESALFHMVGTFEIESNKRYSGWSLTKKIAAFRFSWMPTWSVRTRVFLHDSAGSTFPLNPCESEQQNGVEFTLTEPKRISNKEAQILISQGAITVELDPNSDKISNLPIARFSR